MQNPIETVKAHPVASGLGIVAVLFVLFLMFRGGGGASSGDGGAAAAYYAAQSAQAQSGNQLAMTQIMADAQTAQTQIAATTSIANNTKWADTQLATTQSNNNVALTLGPAQIKAETEQSWLGALAGLAALPPTTTTKVNKGFLGIGGGTKTTTTPNPASLTAASILSQWYEGPGFHAAH